MIAKPTVRRAIFFVAVLMISAFASIGHSNAQTSWDVAKNFSSKKNPDGVWAYLANGTLLSIGEEGCSKKDATGCPGWTNGLGEPDAVTILANNTGAALTGGPTQIIPPGYALMDPQSGYCTITWKTPANGTYTFSGNFVGIDTSQQAHFVHIDLFGTQMPVFDAIISTYGHSAPFSFQMTLTKGQTLAFTIQAGSSFNDLATGLSLQITQ